MSRFQIKWDDSLSIGIKEIDEQHKTLINHINVFIKAMLDGEARYALENLFREIANYTSYHFESEEILMSSLNYQGLEFHAGEHQLFKEKLAAFIIRFKEGDVLVTNEVYGFLRDWFLDHVIGTDQKFGKFYSELKNGTG